MKPHIIVLMIAAFLVSSIGVRPLEAGQIEVPLMPQPGQRVLLSPTYQPAQLKGMVLDANNPLKFDFLIDRGAGNLNAADKSVEYKKLVKYFLAALTVPDDHQWVNLSPYEKNRIVPDDFGQTQMGRDLLSQDYLLKQITSSLMYPESGLGKEFWNKVYTQARAKFHTNQVPVNMFNKVWIVPDQALVYENKGSIAVPAGGSAVILKSRLKVMLEEDYLALQQHVLSSRLSPASLTSDIVRAIIIPELEREINEGRNFALLRQVYSGMVLATWFKRSLKAALLNRVYANQSKISGITLPDATVNGQAIYAQYLQAYKKGVYNYIKEDQDQYTHQIIPRKYFAGGFAANPDVVHITTKLTATSLTGADLAQATLDNVKVNLTATDAAMSPKAMTRIVIEPVLREVREMMQQEKFIPALERIIKAEQVLLSKLTREEKDVLAQWRVRILDHIRIEAIEYIKEQNFEDSLVAIKVYQTYAADKNKMDHLLRAYWSGLLTFGYQLMRLARYDDLPYILRKRHTESRLFYDPGLMIQFQEFESRVGRIRNSGAQLAQALEVLGVKKGDNIDTAYRAKIKAVNHGDTTVAEKSRKINALFAAFRVLSGLAVTRAWNTDDIMLVQLKNDLMELRGEAKSLDTEIVRINKFIAAAPAGSVYVLGAQAHLGDLQKRRLVLRDAILVLENKLKALDPTVKPDAAMSIGVMPNWHVAHAKIITIDEITHDGKQPYDDNYIHNQQLARDAFLKLLEDINSGEVFTKEEFIPRLVALNTLVLVGDGSTPYWSPTMEWDDNPHEKAGVVMSDKAFDKIYMNILLFSDVGFSKGRRVRNVLQHIISFYEAFMNHGDFIFDKGNNSLAMNMVNAMLRLYGLKGISHAHLDGAVLLDYDPRRLSRLFLAEILKENQGLDLDAPAETLLNKPDAAVAVVIHFPGARHAESIEHGIAADIYDRLSSGSNRYALQEAKDPAWKPALLTALEEYVKDKWRNNGRLSRIFQEFNPNLDPRYTMREIDRILYREKITIMCARLQEISQALRSIKARTDALPAVERQELADEFNAILDDLEFYGYMQRVTGVLRLGIESFRQAGQPFPANQMGALMQRIAAENPDLRLENIEAGATGILDNVRADMVEYLFLVNRSEKAGDVDDDAMVSGYIGDWPQRLTDIERYIDGHDWRTAKTMIEKAYADLRKNPWRNFLNIRALNRLIERYNNTLPGYWDRYGPKEDLNLPADRASISDVGGIDFNAKNLNLQLAGKPGSGITANPADVERFAQCKGFEPVIMDIQAAGDIAILHDIAAAAASFH